MSIKLKLLSFILAIIIICSPLVSCKDSSLSNDTTTVSESDTTAPQEEENTYFKTVYPEVSVSKLKYTLSSADVESFDKKLEECEDLFYSNNKENETALKKALYELNSAAVYFETQVGIAYMLYNYNISDKTAQSNQYDSTIIYSEIHDKLWGFINAAIDENNSLTYVVVEFKEESFPFTVKYTLYDDPEPYFAQMLEIKNEILKYNRQATYEQVYDLYTEYIYASRMYAQAYGYDNYYDMANDVDYFRDYGKEEREQLREYVKKYLVPLYRVYRVKSDLLDSKLTASEFRLSEQYLENGYDTFSENLLFAYFNSLPSSSKDSMIEAFEKDRVMVGNNKNSFNGAFVKMIGNTPICYFHKSQTDLITISHELGHYYADTYHGNTAGLSYDLKETHSQTNTLLMFSYLNKKLNNKAFESAQVYSISNMLYQAISSAIKDEFDEIVFSDPRSHNYSIDRLNEIMEALIAEYDVADLSSNITTQLMTHWNRHGIEQVGYYISYTASFVVALQIYLKSLDDYDGAILDYKNVVEKIDWDNTFLKTISNVGLLSPLDEELYKMIVNENPY